MPPVEINTTPLCGHCRMAKRPLNAKRAAHAGTGVSRGPMGWVRAMDP